MLSLTGNALSFFRKNKQVDEIVDEASDLRYADLCLQIEELDHDCVQMSRRILAQSDTIEEGRLEVLRLKDRIYTLDADKASSEAGYAEERAISQAHQTALVGVIVAARNYIPESNSILLGQIDQVLSQVPGSLKVLDKIRAMDGALYQIVQTEWEQINPPDSIPGLVRQIASRGLGASD